MGIYNENPLDNLTGEQIRELFNRAVQDEAHQNQEQKEREAALDFIAAHPEYRACPENGRVMQAAIDYAGLKADNFQTIEEVYFDLRNRGLIVVDPEIIKQ